MSKQYSTLHLIFDNTHNLRFQESPLTIKRFDDTE